MKPNDKAIEAAQAEGKRWKEGLNRPENQIPCWKVLREADDGYYGYDVIAKFNSCEERDKALERLRAEAMLTAAYAAQFYGEEYAGLIKELRACEGSIFDEAADALEEVLAERDDFSEQLALRSKSGMAKDMQEIMRINNELQAERDALAARLAPVEAIENDKDDPTREYIPLPGGWEIQTKGKGSSYRLLDKKTDERHMILAGDEQFVHDFVTRMAKEINASSQVRPVAPVDDEALVEIVAREIAFAQGDVENPDSEFMDENWHCWEPEARAAIAAIRPHIEAAERERCAKAVETVGEKINVAHHERPEWEDGYLQGVHDAAAAIRSGKWINSKP